MRTKPWSHSTRALAAALATSLALLACGDEAEVEVPSFDGEETLEDSSSGGLSEPPGPGGPDIPPFLEADPIVGIAFSADSDAAYAWTAASTVSAGIAAQLTSVRSPYRWSDSVVSTPVEFALNSADTTFVWYANGKVGKGSSSNPTAIATYDYTLPGGRTPGQIVGMAIKKSTDVTYAFYSDGTYSTGTTAAPGSATTGTVFAAPPGKTVSGILAMDFDKHGRLFTWFKDGTFCYGTPADLDFYQSPRRYARHGMLASVYPADVSGPLGPQSDWPPPPPIPNTSTATIQSPPAHTFDIDKSTFDILVAPGRDALGLSYDGEVFFHTKSGVALTGGILGSTGKLPLPQMLAEFMRFAPVPSGQLPAANDVNQYLGFTQPCDGASVPTTRGYKYCVASQPVDARVEYDVVGDRWVVAAAVRNEMWTNYFQNKHAHPDWSESELLNAPFDSGATHSDNCGVFAGPNSVNQDLPTGAHCKEARRLVAIAVSRTSDPRDGFFTYMFVESNYRDWPWIAVDGDWVILSHQGREDPAGPVSSLVSLADMRAGRVRPQYIHYFHTDLQGYVRAEPPRQMGTFPSHSLLTAPDNSKLVVFALPHPDQRYGKKAATSAALNNPDLTDFPPELMTYRNGKLHLAKTVDVAGRKETRFGRVPLTMSGNTPVLSASAGQGYKLQQVNALGSSTLDHDSPIFAVNGGGEIFLAWGNYGRDPGAMILPSVKHARWRPDSAPWFDTERTFRAGDGFASGGSDDQIKASAAAVDPVDDSTFWAIHRYGKSGGGWGIVVGSVDPNEQ